MASAPLFTLVAKFCLFSLAKKKYNKIKSNIVQRYKPELSTEERIADYEEKVSLEGLYKLSIVSDKLEEHEKSC